jgi:hypothetical protein
MECSREEGWVRSKVLKNETLPRIGSEAISERLKTILFDKKRIF